MYTVSLQWLYYEKLIIKKKKKSKTIYLKIKIKF